MLVFLEDLDSRGAETAIFLHVAHHSVQLPILVDVEPSDFLLVQQPFLIQEGFHFGQKG